MYTQNSLAEEDDEINSVNLYYNTVQHLESSKCHVTHQVPPGAPRCPLNVHHNALCLTSGYAIFAIYAIYAIFAICTIFAI